jgi:hypothetical protein
MTPEAAAVGIAHPVAIGTGPATVSVAGWVVLFGSLFIGGWLRWHRVAPKTSNTCFLVAGLLVARLISTPLGFVVGLVGSRFGGQGWRWAWALLAVVVAGATIELVIKGVGVWRGHAAPHRWHPWLALVVPTLAIALGVPVLGPLMTGLAAAVSTVGTPADSVPASGHPHHHSGSQSAPEPNTDLASHINIGSHSDRERR